MRWPECKADFATMSLLEMGWEKIHQFFLKKTHKKHGGTMISAM